MPRRSALASSIAAASDRPRHPLEGPPTSLKRRYFPYGFPVEVATNSAKVHDILGDLWNPFTERFAKAPVQCEIVVKASRENRCPPEPRFHLHLPLLFTVCDGENFSIVDLERFSVLTHITEAALLYPRFTGYSLLSNAYSCLCTRYATPIHAACVAWRGYTMLLCGDSGAGKSTLAFACAKEGFVYTSDDASYLLNDEAAPRVAGNCYQFRLRPEAVQHFPEIAGLKVAARPAGKPSVEVPASSLRSICTAPSAAVNAIVFLHRGDAQGAPTMVPACQQRARTFMLESLFGPPKSIAMQTRAIDRLLEVPVFGMQYETLGQAIELLRKLAEEHAHAGRIATIV